MEIYPLGNTLTYTTANLKNLMNWLEDNQCIDYDKWKKKLSSSPQPSTNLRGEENPYAHIVYSPLTIWNHNRGQVSGSMNADPINMIQKIQKPTKEGLKNNLKDILDQAKKLIEANKYGNPIGTLATTFQKTVG